MSCRKTFTIGSGALTCVSAFLATLMENDFKYGSRQVDYFIAKYYIPGLWYLPDSLGTPTQLSDPPDSVAPITWSINNGNLPSGMSLSTIGLFSGTPDEQFSYEETVNEFTNELYKHYYFTVKAVDSDGTVWLQDVDFPVQFCLRMEVLSITLPTGCERDPDYFNPNANPDVGWDQIGPMLFIGDAALYHQYVNELGVVTLAFPPSPVGMSRQGGGLWMASLTVHVRFVNEPNTWIGSIVYELENEISPYGTKIITGISSWSGTINGIESDPPAFDGSATIRFS